jgi:hypothetical protein
LEYKSDVVHVAATINEQASMRHRDAGTDDELRGVRVSKNLFLAISFAES